MSIIQIQHLYKTFGTGENAVHALEDISLDIQKGEIFGIIGLSGAGKSTLVRCMNLLERPTSGTVIVDGKDMTSLSDRELRLARRNVTMIFQSFNLLMQRTVLKNVCFPMEISGVPAAKARKRALELLELVGLADAADRRLGGYSKGMLQRIGMAQALVQSPRLLVLDEPTAGVDPLGSRDIRNIIENLKGRGMTVFLCSHLLEQVQEVCDRVGVIFKGLLIAEGSVNELTRDSDKQEILLEHASPELMERLKNMVKEDGRAVWLEDGHPRNSLESVFLKSLLEWKEKHPNPES